MNLTKLFAASLCFTAMTASAGFIGVTNDFEGGTLEGTWTGGATAAFITNIITSVSDNNSPIKGNTDTKVLELNTNGGVWTNEINGGTPVSFASAPVWVDMLVKFVESDATSLPTFDSAVKLAIAATNGSLIVTKKQDNSNVWASTQTAIDTGLWYRVTVKLSREGSAFNASVTLNGSEQVSVGGETIFQIFDSEFEGELSAIGLQGTGFVDEIAVCDDDPLTGTPAVVQLTLSFTSGEMSVLVSGTGTNAAPVVPSGTVLDVIAAPFYEIASKSVTNDWTSGGVGYTNGTITVSADDDATVTFTAQPWTSTNALGGVTAFANAPATNVAAWAIANEVTELTNEMYENYLLNIAEDATVPEMQIASISVSGTTVTVTITTTGNSVNFTQINGTLKLKLYETLGGTETKEVVQSFDGTTTAEVVMDIVDAKFVRATVE